MPRKRKEQRKNSVLLLLTAVASPLIAGASLWITIESSEQQWKDAIEDRVLVLEKENDALKAQVGDNKRRLDQKQIDACVIRTLDKLVDKTQITPSCDFNMEE